jgi:hypothetical protein
MLVLVLESAWIQGTISTLTYFSLFEGLKFQALMTKERLKLVLGLKFFSQGILLKCGLVPSLLN